jgi:UV DNA damage endonuclease
MIQKSSYIMTIQLGLCCINTVLRKKGVYCSRTMIRKNFTVEKAQEYALANIRDAETLMAWNHAHDIHVFRLSSDMFPHFTDLETESYSMNFAIPALQELGKSAVRYNQRITFHPGQYNQIGTPTRDVFEKTVSDLTHHAMILDYMGMDQHSVMCIHGGGTYGDKEKTMRRWIDQFDELPKCVKRRLAIENCERQYSTEDCLELACECRIPVIFDTHHDACYRELHKDYEPEDVIDQMPAIIDSWGSKTPLMHISEQRPDARIGAHSDFIQSVPDYLLDLKQQGLSFDLEVEAKAKEQAILRLYDLYPSTFN